MPTRRSVLRLAASGPAGLAGCLGRNSTDARTVTPAPVPATTAGPGSSTGPSTASPTPDDELTTWSTAWELPVDHGKVLGLDVVDGTLYATAGREGGPSAVVAVDPEERTAVWETELEGEAIGGSAAGYRPIARDGWGVTVAGDAVYAVSGRADSYDWTSVHAIGRSNGERRWLVRRPRRLAVHGVVDGLVVATGLEFFEPEHSHDTPGEPLTSEVYGIDAADGEVRWTAAFDGVADVGVGPDGVFVAAGERLVGLDFDGSRRFEYPGSHAGRAVRAASGRVYYLTAPGHDRSVVHGLSPAGDRAWRTTLPVHEVLLDGDRLYAGGSAVVALEPDGSTVWRDDASYGQWLLLDPGGETLYTRAGRSQDRVTAYRTGDGTERWTYRPPDLSSRDAWPVAATTDTLVAEGITAEHGDDPFTTLYAVDRRRGVATHALATEPVYDVESVGGTVVVAGATLLALEP